MTLAKGSNYSHEMMAGGVWMTGGYEVQGSELRDANDQN